MRSRMRLENINEAEEIHKMDRGALNRQMWGYFQSSFGMYEYRRGWAKGQCPWCGADDKFGVNLEENKAHCFKCDHRAKPYKVIMDQEGMRNFGELARFLKTYDTAEYRPIKVERVEEVPIVLPTGFKLLKYGDGRIGNMARNYMKGRGFNIKEISRKGIGYVGWPREDYFGYIIFPYYKNRKIIYFQTRLYFGSGPKFKNPRYEDYGVGKSQVLYGIHNLERYKEIHIVESVTNALTLGNQAVGTNGKSLSSWQKSQLIKSKAELFNILLDKDALKEAFDLASQLVIEKNVRVILFEDDKDVNDLGRKVTLKKIKESPILTTHNEVMKLKWSLSERLKKK